MTGQTPDEVETAFADARGYGDFKTAVGEAVAAHLAPVRERYEALRPDEAALEATLAAGAEKARAIAGRTLDDVREAMGVGPVRARARSLPGPCPPLSRTSNWTSTSSPGRSTCCCRSSCARSWTCWRSTWRTSCSTYVDHLEQREELDLEATTEFLVLIAALLELKSRLMLPGEELEELDELVPAEAADELLARMLAYARYRGAAAHLREAHEAGRGFLYRSAPPPASLRRASLQGAEAVFAPDTLGRAIGGLLRHPQPVDLTHMRGPTVTVEQRLSVLRGLLRRGRFSFDEAVAGEDRMTVCVTLWALLELYKRGEAAWEQEEPFGAITVARSDVPGVDEVREAAA